MVMLWTVWYYDREHGESEKENSLSLMEAKMLPPKNQETTVDPR
jgi:hypothetical protein